MKIYDLRYGQRFIVPEHPDLGVLIFLKTDGAYGQVRAGDPAVQAQGVAAYDQGAPFFCLAASTDVETV